MELNKYKNIKTNNHTWCIDRIKEYIEKLEQGIIKLQNTNSMSHYDAGQKNGYIAAKEETINDLKKILFK